MPRVVSPELRLISPLRFRSRRPVDVEARSSAPEPTDAERGDTVDDPPRRRVRDAERSTDLPGRMVRREGEPATEDAATDEAYRGLGATYQLFRAAYERDSLDDRGMPPRATVHYGDDYSNAFWDGTRMVFGDGDGELFRRFTVSIDVIGHELAHGVTEHTADLVYSGQSGALNESVSDVFGSLVKVKSTIVSVDGAPPPAAITSPANCISPMPPPRFSSSPAYICARCG